MAPLHELQRTIKRKGRKLLIGGGLGGLAAFARLHPNARPSRHGVEVVRDIAYTETGRAAHLLDVYRPVGATLGATTSPVVLYLHGGGFTQLSKDTHWVMGLAFARAGYVVFNASYRLAPRHPYPSALEDVCAAFEWVVRNASSHGGDIGRLVIAGESAGANLATALAVASCYQRPEPFAKRIYESGVVPSAIVPMCGLLQVSAPERFWQRRKLPPAVRAVLADVSASYLATALAHPEGGTELADPLLILEGEGVPDRPLPPMFASVGTRDPLLDDTRRLAAALAAKGVDHHVAYRAGEAHAFQAFVWRRASRVNWRDTYRFLDRVLENSGRTSATSVGKVLQE